MSIKYDDYDDYDNVEDVEEDAVDDIEYTVGFTISIDQRLITLIKENEDYEELEQLLNNITHKEYYNLICDYISDTSIFFIDEDIRTTTCQSTYDNYKPYIKDLFNAEEYKLNDEDLRTLKYNFIELFKSRSYLKDNIRALIGQQALLFTVKWSISSDDCSNSPYDFTTNSFYLTAADFGINNSNTILKPPCCN